MNFKVLANFIMLISLGAFAYGANIYMQADKEAAALGAELRKLGYKGELPQPGSTADLQRKAKQEEAKKYFFLGGAIFLLGAGMSAAATSPVKETEKSQETA